jgi:NADPH:quinone reductase-like Zn-dependent oxidoreductase
VRGRYGYQPELPASPGAEGVGIVEAVGPGAQGSLVGTRMIFVTSGLSSIDTKNILSLQSASS